MFSALNKLTPSFLLDWRTQLLPLLWFAYVHIADRPLSGSDWLIRSGVLLSSYAGFIATIWLFKVFWLDRGPQTWLVLRISLTLAAAGFVRGVVFGSQLEQIGFSTPEEFWYRVAASVFNGWCATILAAAAVAASTNHSRQVNLLRAEQARLKNLQDYVIPQSVRAHEKLVKETKQSLSRIFGSAAKLSTEEFLAMLRRTIDDVVRPISYELERGAQPKLEPNRFVAESRLHWDEVVRNSTRPGAVRAPELAIFLTLVVLPASAFKFGYLYAVVIFAYLMTFGLLVFWLTGKLINALLRNDSVWFRTAVLFSSLIIASGVVIVASYPITQGTADPFYFWNYSPVFVAISGFAFSVGHSALIEAEVVREKMTQVTKDLAWDIARARELQRQRQRNLARALHGSTQALLASTYLKATAKAKDSELSTAYKAKVAKELSDQISRLDSSGANPISLSEAFDQVSVTWSEIATIHIETSPFVGDQLALDPVCLTAVVDIIPELAFNAVKHGNAKHIFISVSRLSDREIEVEVANDGKLLGVETREGLGSQLLRETSLEWSRKNDGDLVVTRAVLPYLPQATSTQQQSSAKATSLSL